MLFASRSNAFYQKSKVPQAISTAGFTLGIHPTGKNTIFFDSLLTNTHYGDIMQTS